MTDENVALQSQRFYDALGIGSKISDTVVICVCLGLAPASMIGGNDALLASALAGAGIAYGPTFVFGKHLRRGELVALLPAYRATELVIQAVYPSARHIPLKVRRFVDYLTEAFGDEPPWDRRAKL